MARHGELSGDQTSSEVWAHDAQYPELLRLNAELDRLQNEKDLVTEEMLAIPASTRAGVVAKLRVGLDMWRGVDIVDMASYELATLAIMEDAVRMLTKLE